MRIYIAGRFEDRESFHPVRERLHALGHVVTATWLDEMAPGPNDTQAQFYRECALRDLADLAQADALVLCTLAVSIRGGAACEYGWALHAGKDVYIVGPKSSVFHELCNRQFDTWDDFLESPIVILNISNPV